MSSQATRTNLSNQFIRQFGVPIDRDFVFETSSARIAYIENAATSGLAYIGMIVADQETNKAYLLDSNRQWVEVGSNIENLVVGNITATGIATFGGAAVFDETVTFSGQATFDETVTFNNEVTFEDKTKFNDDVDMSGVTVTITNLAQLAVANITDIFMSNAHITDTIGGESTYDDEQDWTHGNLQIKASGADFSGYLTVNDVPVSLSGHTHQWSDVTDLTGFCDSVAQCVDTSLTPNSGIQIVYDENTNNVNIGLSGEALAQHLINTTGFISRSGTNTYVTRTIQQGSNIVVTNGSGTNGNPVIALDTNVTGLTSLSGSTISANNIYAVTDIFIDNKSVATKEYVDALEQGLDVKKSVVVATTTDIALDDSTTVVDGVTLQDGWRILVKDQVDAEDNGIYIVSTSGSWTRATDADSDVEVTAGLFTFVERGDTNADSGWVLITNDPITLGTTELEFSQFSGAGQITAGSGLVKDGNTIDARSVGAGSLTITADSINLAVTNPVNSGTVGSGTVFVSSLNVDVYGRVVDFTSQNITLATNSTLGIASFNSTDFNVAAGDVTLNSSVIRTSGDFTLAGNITFSQDINGNLNGIATNADNIEIDISNANINPLVFVSGVDGYLKPSVNNNLRFDAANNILYGDDGDGGLTPTSELQYFIIDGGTP